MQSSIMFVGLGWYSHLNWWLDGERVSWCELNLRGYFLVGRRQIRSSRAKYSHRTCRFFSQRTVKLEKDDRVKLLSEVL